MNLPRPAGFDNLPRFGRCYRCTGFNIQHTIFIQALRQNLPQFHQVIALKWGIYKNNVVPLHIVEDEF